MGWGRGEGGEAYRPPSALLVYQASPYLPLLTHTHVMASSAPASPLSLPPAPAFASSSLAVLLSKWAQGPDGEATAAAAVALMRPSRSTGPPCRVVWDVRGRGRGGDEREDGSAPYGGLGTMEDGFQSLNRTTQFPLPLPPPPHPSVLHSIHGTRCTASRTAQLTTGNRSRSVITTLPLQRPGMNVVDVMVATGSTLAAPDAASTLSALPAEPPARGTCCVCGGGGEGGR